MENEALKLKGSLIAEITHADGTKEVRRKDNLILSAGFDFIADAIGNGSDRPDAMSYIAVGTGTDDATTSDTELGGEVTRKSATYAHTSGTQVFTFKCTFSAGEATGALTEAGVCNASSDGTFLDRVTFDVINKASDDTLAMTFQFTLA